MAGVNGQSGSTPIAWVRGKKSLATARAEVLRLSERYCSSPREKLAGTLAFVLALLTALGTCRFVGDRMFGGLLLHERPHDRVANIHGLVLYGVQPTDTLAGVHIAQLLT
jgi:hypothetical protein